MAQYTLYTDESETKDPNGKKYFVISGVIIDDTDYSKIETELNSIKQTVWNGFSHPENFILHEKDISSAHNGSTSNVSPEYLVFRKNCNVTLLYNNLSKLFKSMPLITLGVCLNKKQLYTDYYEKCMNSQYSIAIQLLLEHYCQFLLEKDSTGSICYEAMEVSQNNVIQQRIYDLKALGTMYYSPITIQNRVKEINFTPKSENEAGLQIADFVPNTLARYAAKLKPKNASFAQNVRRTLYKSNDDRLKNKFGFKILE